MNSSYLKYLCCPKCKSDLMINTDYLSCIKCSIKYKIQNNIPILIDLNNLPSHLQQQIKYFEDEKITDNNNYKLEAWQKSYIEKFNNNFSEIKNKLIIDCGTGSGYSAIELTKRGGMIIANDLTLKSLIRLKKIAENLNLSENIIFVCCSAEELPFKNNIADYFISNAVLEHLPEEKRAIKEIDRVCKPKSGLMITVPLSYKYLNPLFLGINYLHDKRIGHLRRYDEQILINKLANWKILKTYYTGHFTKVLKTIINLIVKIFGEENIEKQDRENENKKQGASNIIAFFKKE